jgi:hypothetical protein
MRIEPRYNGPRESGNGGWSAGLVAGYLTGPAEVTLWMPPPIGVDLAVERDGDAVRVSTPDGRLVAEGERTTVGDEERVEPVPWADAVTASAGYPGFAAHPFPTCFVCGPDRAPGDGLRLFPGRLGDGRTATPWQVPDDVSPTMVWAALDCPGGWSVGVEARPYVLGRLAVRVDGVPAAGARCVVMGEVTRSVGRKATVRSTLYGPDGTALASSRATWIAIA